MKLLVPLALLVKALVQAWCTVVLVALLLGAVLAAAVLGCAPEGPHMNPWDAPWPLARAGPASRSTTVAGTSTAGQAAEPRGLAGAAVSLAGELDPKDFAATWEPVLRSRMQWVQVSHALTGRTFRLKCAWCVSDPWKKLKPDKAATARQAWLDATAVAYMTRVLYAESAEGIKAAKIAEAEAAVEKVKEAGKLIEKIKAEHPDADLPTVTVTEKVNP